MKSVKVYWLEGESTHQNRFLNADVLRDDDNTLVISAGTRKILFNPNSWLRFEVDES